MNGRIAFYSRVAAAFFSGMAFGGDGAVRPCFRNLDPEAKALLADFAREGADWKAPSGQTRLFVRGQFFYGLERSDYIHNWYERPLFQDTSYATSNERGHTINEKSWRKTVAVAKEMGLDGFAFFLENPGCRDVFSRSLLPDASITVLGEFASDREIPRGVEYCADVADALLAAPNAFRIGGKTVLTSYPFTTWANKSVDFWPRLRAELIRRHGEDKFLFVPYLLVFNDADLDRTAMSAATLEKTRAHLREVLRKTDGLVYMLHETDWAPPEKLRVAHDEIVIPLVKSVMNEPEFRGKCLGIGFWQGHENVYRHMGIYPSYGLRRLVTALDSISKVGPDFAIGFEWDEENENTHFRPTVSNGQTSQRVMRFYSDRFRGKSPSMRAGDDPTVPNLILSYRKSAQAGELLEAQVCGVPDGTAPADGWEVSFRWKTPDGRIVREFSAQRIKSDTCSIVSFDAPVSSLVENRVLVPELSVSGGGRPARVFADGFWPVSLEPNVNPDVKWVRQALREVIPGVTGTLAIGEPDREGFHTVKAQVKSSVPLRSIEVLDGIDTVYLHDAKKPTGRDLKRRTVRVAFLAMPCFWKERAASGTVEVVHAPGAVLSELLPHYVRRKGFKWTINHNPSRLNFKSVLYADIPEGEFDAAEVAIDFPDVLATPQRIRVRDVFAENGISVALPSGGQIVVTPCTQVGMPAPCNVTEADFAFPLKVRNPNGVLRLQAIDETGRLWRGPSIALGKDSGRRRTIRVYERASGDVTEVEADEARLLSLDFTFPENFTGAVRSGDRLDMPAVFGGGEGILNERGCGANGNLTYGHAMACGNPPLDRPNAKFITLPRQSLPPYSGFDLRIRLRPNGLRGREGVYDAGNLGLRIWLTDGVPHAFLSLGNEMLRIGKNDTAGVTVTGPKLVDGAWNDLRLVFDQRTAHLEINGVCGEAKPCCGYEHGTETPALGALFKEWCFFHGRFGSFSIRSFSQATHRRVLPEPIVAVQTQLYPWREQARGYLGRYPNQPLLVDPDLPEDTDRSGIGEFPGWGSFHSQADYDRTLREIRDAKIDAMALFCAGRPRRFFTAGADSKVDGVGVLPILTCWSKDVTNNFREIETALANPRAMSVNGKLILPSYWMGKYNTPAELKEKFAAIRGKYGDRFTFIVSLPILSAKWFVYERDGRRLSDEDRKFIEDNVRAYVDVADGIQICEAHMLGKQEDGHRVFADGYWEIVHEIVAKVLDEPAYRGRKLLCSAAVVAHMNAYRGGHEIAEDGTRTLRRSLETAIKYNADYIMLPEWDEYNENTCFMPTLYSAFTVKRVLRHYLGKLRHVDYGVLAGDDVTKPNLIVSYRKSLSPGEALVVEVLNVPDGARDGTLSVGVELADENGNTLRRFAGETIDEAVLSEIRLKADTADLAPRTRAMQVRLFWKKGSETGSIVRGLHAVDLVPGGEWNHLCVRQPLRDLARPTKADVSLVGNTMRAAFRSDKPIRYAMLCGNGCIQAIRGKPGSDADRFREDDEAAVFQITVLPPDGHEIRAKKGTQLDFAVDGAETVEWHYQKEVVKGERFAHRAEIGGLGPSTYLRIPKSQLKNARFTYDLLQDGKGEIALEKAFRLGAFTAAGTNGVQVTVARFRHQDRYPSVANANEISFDLPVAADRASMCYHVQLVTMDGKVWFSEPFVVEKSGERIQLNVKSVLTGKTRTICLPSARVPELSYDFSPEAGAVVRPTNGEQHWFGMLGGPYTPATLWNRGCRTEGVIPWNNDFYRQKLRPAVPTRVREPDGTWSLAFDGDDDYVGFPWTTLPAFGGFTVSFDICPDALPEKKRAFLFGSQEIARLFLQPNGTLAVTYIEMFSSASLQTKLRLVPGVWSHVTLACDGETLVLSVDGRSAPPLMVKLPGRGTTPVSLGGFPAKDLSFFKGRIRNFTCQCGL